MGAFMLLAMMERPRGAALASSRPWTAALPDLPLDLAPAAGSLVCGNRHSFDLARDGYVNLLNGRRRSLIAGGDSAEQLDHRAAFLEAGHFNPVASAIASQVAHAAPGWRVLDAGCGTGHHLAGVAAALRTPLVGLGVDIARTAAQRAARRWRELAFAVADVWTEWPVQDEAADLVLSIFAPKNFAECPASFDREDGLPWPIPGPITLPSSSIASVSCNSMPAKPTATPRRCNGGAGHRPPFGSCTA